MQSLRHFFDLPFFVSQKFLTSFMVGKLGKVLDIHAGTRSLTAGNFAPSSEQISAINSVSLDLLQARFDLPQRPEPIPFDGQKFPFLDANFDLILCNQVLELVENPTPLLKEIHRSLSPSGTLLITLVLPAQNRRPQQSLRLTKLSLSLLLEKNDFEVLSVQPLGNNLTRTAYLLVQMSVRTKLLGLFYLPFTFVLLGLAHLSLKFNFGGQTDPLGYSLVAKKSAQRQLGT